MVFTVSIDFDEGAGMVNRHGFHGSYLFKDGLIGERDSLDALSIRENPYGAIGTHRWMCCHPTDRL